MNPGDAAATRPRRSSSRRSDRSHRLARWPLLRLLATSPAFRLVVLLGLLVAVAVPLLLLKLWTITPPHIKPPMRISLLDRIQAWSLKRNARAAEARGDYENARATWRAALVNNPADVIGLREALRVIPRTAQPAEASTLGLSWGTWLLQLGETNVTDLELVVSVWNTCELYDRSALLLASLPELRSTELNRLRAVAYFRSGRIAAFEELLRSDADLKRAVDAALEPRDTNPPQPRPNDELRMVSLGYLAAWGPPETRETAQERLRQLAREPRWEKWANELLLNAYLQLRDVEQCEAALRQLEATGRVNLLYRIAYWRLLAQEGRRQEAVEKVREANPAPRTDAEILRLVGLYAALEMYEEADELCRRYLNDPPWLLDGAILRADLLMRLEHWDDLRRLALRLRLFPDIMEVLGGFSAFLEGMAQWHEGYTLDAERSFETAARTGFRDPRLALRVADNLMRLGLVHYAEPILLLDNVRAALSRDPEYLRLRFRCATARRNADSLYETALAMYELTPNDPLVLNNYAAAILLLRTNVEKAVVHTFRLASAFTNSFAVQLNHVVALTQNGRVEEADARLAALPLSAMQTSEERSQYYLALFEIRLRQGRKHEARLALQQVSTADLYPPQIRWLEGAAAELEALPDEPAPGVSNTASP